MKFLVIDYKSVKEIVSDRHLQSSDYSKGDDLYRCVRDGIITDFHNEIAVIKKNNGLIFLSNEPTPNKLLVIDTENFQGFNRSPNEVITIIQKSLRLAIKTWEGIGNSPCEKLIHGTSYIALMPFPFVTGKSYKVMLDKRPEGSRQDKRKEENLLIFFDGYDDWEKPVLANFRKAIEAYYELKYFDHIKNVDNGSEVNSQYVSINEINGVFKNKNPHLGMDFWAQNLTQSQKDFVFSDSLGPDIIKGAAGTGKTLSLVLRCINQLNKAREEGKPRKVGLFTHSIATKEAIKNLIFSNEGGCYIDSEGAQSVEVTTLQEWCINNFANRISATEYLDKDALESKQLQLMYISEVIDDFLLDDFEGSKYFVSKELNDFFSSEDRWSIYTLVQHEMSTYIKGRASEDFDTYKSLDRSINSIPLKKEEDFSTLYMIFNKYQDKLIDLNLFDSDDITISALQETSTPIYKRRRLKDGFDIVYIDESHLFNMNELSLFHNLLKVDSTNIVFTYDRSQATGDTAVSSIDILSQLKLENETDEQQLNAIFRSSDQIIQLSSCILASGATLFSHLENPLIKSTSGQTIVEEKKCIRPYLLTKNNEEDVVLSAFKEVDDLSKKLQVHKSKILIVPTNDAVINKIESISESHRLSIELIVRRGDTQSIINANEKDKYIVGGMDYIGGLEFDAVVIVGIDKDKLPNRGSGNESHHFLTYSAYNQLYVAITRAKYTVAFISNKTKGTSSMISVALEEGLIIQKQG
ncbi:UvrD-helicase domain-containing protein [Salinivibrio kushneri]|uniref:UvrD-helicase domain-containing protein n=1 Tax=Salinivibrio kushneri TaxID=1908198 RepID=UPI00098690CF|nr:UvrD-helicase domain-containing protein [Salinivibrio kushneri]OOE62980.1 DNA helicase UvrD [Salinivibrio kushneri]